VHKAKFMKVQG